MLWYIPMPTENPGESDSPGFSIPFCFTKTRKFHSMLNRGSENEDLQKVVILSGRFICRSV